MIFSTVCMIPVIFVIMLSKCECDASGEINNLIDINLIYRTHEKISGHGVLSFAYNDSSFRFLFLVIVKPY